MDFQPNGDQQAIQEAVEALLARHAGAERAIALAAKGETDGELEAALAEAGYRDLALGPETGPLEAALVVEAVSRAAGLVSAGASLLVAPMLLGEAAPGPVALAAGDEPVPLRFGAHAPTLLVARGDEAFRVDLTPADREPVPSNFGYPMGRVRADVRAKGRSLGAGSGPRLRAWWRVALALEAAGSMRAALALTVDYVQRRRQFGRPIGSFQAVQHRLAECEVLVSGAHWLALEAAFHGADPERSALAAAHALEAAGRVFHDTHQFTGAMGFTLEHDLHVHTMRLQALRLELGGLGSHRVAASRARWVGTA